MTTPELSNLIYNNEVWSNAVNFVYEGEDTKSQVIENLQNRKIIVTSKGIDARGMNVLIMSSLSNIIQSYRGVKAEIVVRCTCNTCKRLSNPTSFRYERLLEWSKIPNRQVRCNESQESFSVSELLYSVGFEKKGAQQSVKIISIFLASSEELKEDRKEFEIFINRENNNLTVDYGIFIKLEIWENSNDFMSETRLQDEYNRKVANSDIFVSLFWTKVGKYTKEEFSKALDNFKKKGRPLIYTYFKNESVSINSVPTENLISLADFKKELENLGHFPTIYKTIEDLKYKFKMQLQSILRNNIIK